MVVSIKISSSFGSMQDLVNNISENIKTELGEAGWDYCRLVQRNLRFQVSIKNLIWRRKLWEGIQARRNSRFTSTVVIPKSGIYLDRMKPHYVKLKRGRLIRQWAMQKGNERLRDAAKKEQSIFVRPHPFIDRALELSKTKLESMIESRTNKAIEGAR